MIQWIALPFSIIGIILNAKKNKLCWVLMSIGSILWVGDSVATHQWPVTMLFSIYLLLNIYGWHEWSKKAC